MTNDFEALLLGALSSSCSSGPRRDGGRMAPVRSFTIASGYGCAERTCSKACFPGGNVFLINAATSLASPSCARWLPNDRISLVAGDWNGYCERRVPQPAAWRHLHDVLP